MHYSWKILAGIVFFFILSNAYSADLNKFKLLIESGKLSSVKAEIELALTNPEVSQLDKAIMLKMLATAEARLNFKKESYAEKFDESTKILKVLANTGDISAKTELGLVLFQKANCLLYTAQNSVFENKLAGIHIKDCFEILKEYVYPAQTALSESENYYPSDLKGDIYLLQGDLELFVVRLKKILDTASSDPTAYQKPSSLYEKALAIENEKEKSVQRNDLLQKALLMQSICLLEGADLSQDKSEIPAARNKTFSKLRQAENLSSGNKELNISIALYKSKLQLDSAEADKKIPAALEIELLKTADMAENLRAEVSRLNEYSMMSKYFSTRTCVYEQLLRLYALQDRPDKMLEAVEKMKARSFNDMLKSCNAASPFSDNFDLEKLRNRLKDENAGLVEYFIGPDKSYLIWVSGNKIEFKELAVSGQELVKKINFLVSVFSDGTKLRVQVRRKGNGGGNLPEYEKAFKEAKQLYDILLKPVINDFAGEKLSLLYIVPQHVMNYLPFYALVMKYDENLATSTYFLESDIPLAYLPSASVLNTIPQDSFAGESLIFARSDFHSYPPNFNNDLQNTIPEAKNISGIVGGKLYMEKDAREDILGNVRETLYVLYFATHGVLDKENPLNSHILLSATDADDGKLTASELLGKYRGKLRSELTVLSACKTNRGETNPLPGDDISTLGRFFLVSGSRSVLTTQWEAEDKAFLLIMSHFLINWHEKKFSKSSALHSALKTFISDKDAGSYRYPMFWAPAILIGDGK